MNWANLLPDTRAKFTNTTPSAVDTNTAGVSFTLGSATFGRTITFTPQGEASLQGNMNPESGFDDAIAIGFRQSRGTTIGQEAAVILDGATGTPRILNFP